MDIFTVFRAAKDPEKAAAMEAYMRNQFEFLGLQTPARRKLSREFLAQANKGVVDWGFVSACWDQPEREFQYLALDYLRKLQRHLTPADLPRLRILVLTKSWWDTIDFLDTIIGDITLRHPEVKSILLEWSLDENFWLRRIAIDHQLMHKDKTDCELLEQILLNNLGQKEFFINKAIGWSLRAYSKTDPAWVQQFIERNREKMSPLSIREASRYLGKSHI